MTKDVQNGCNSSGIVNTLADEVFVYETIMAALWDEERRYEMATENYYDEAAPGEVANRVKPCGQVGDPGRAKRVLHYGCVIEREVRDTAGYKVTKLGEEIGWEENFESAMWIARNSEY